MSTRSMEQSTPGSTRKRRHEDQLSQEPSSRSRPATFFIRPDMVHSHRPAEDAAKPIQDRSYLFPAEMSIETTQCRVGSRFMRSRAFNSRDLKHGFPVLALREVLISREQRPGCRAVHMTMDAKDQKPRLFWPMKGCALPKLCGSYNTRSNMEDRKAWAYQLIWVMSFFHARGQPLGNVFLPGMLSCGRYTHETEAYINKRGSHVMPNMLCLFANDVMRLGNIYPRAMTLLSHMAPETLMGARERGPAADVWALACSLFSLFLRPSSENKASGDPVSTGTPLFYDRDSDSMFGHLIQIFKFVGTPNEQIWPGVKRLPHYNSLMPVWQPDTSRLEEVISPELQQLLERLLAANPRERMSAGQIMEHSFFSDIRGSVERPTPPSADALLSALLRCEARQMEESDGARAVRQTWGATQQQVPEPMQRPTPTDRAHVVDWLVSVAFHYELSDDTLFLCALLLDRFLLREPVRVDNLQLLATACLLVASKAVDTVRIPLSELCDMSTDEYTVRAAGEMERRVLQTLDFNVALLTPLPFLRVYLAEARAPFHTRCLAFRLAHILLVHESSLLYRSSTVALSAVVLAFSGEQAPPLPRALRLLPHTDQLYSPQCTRAMYRRWVNCADRPRGHSLREVHIKYSSVRLARAALVRPVDVSAERAAERNRARGNRHDPALVLPMAVMTQLLHFLDKPEMCIMSCVSREWNKLCRDVSLNRGEWDFRGYSEVIDVRTLVRNLVPRFADVQALNLFRCKLDVRAVNVIFEHCRGLRRMNLSYTRVDKRAGGGATDAGAAPALTAVAAGELTIPSGGRVPAAMTAATLNNPYQAHRELSFRAGSLSGAPQTRCHGGSPRTLSLAASAVTTLGDRERRARNALARASPRVEVKLVPPFLEDINLRCSELFLEQDIVSIVRGARKLRRLNLGMLQCVSRRTIDAMAESSMAPSIEVLYLNSCPRVDDDCIGILADACKSLRELYLDMCRNISDEGVRRAAKKLPLRVLSLCANAICNSSLEAIANHCPDIEQLELSFCYNCDSEGVVQLAKCSKIRRLNLCLVDHIRDDAIEAIAKECDLVELNLRGCPNITDRSLFALREHCKNLRVLHLLGCDRLATSTVSLLKHSLPSVEIILW